MSNAVARAKLELKLRGYSPATFKSYISVIRRFVSSLDDEQDPEIEQARRFLLQFAERGVSSSTFNGAAAALRFFFDSVLGGEWPTERIPYHKRKRRLPVVLTRSEILALLQATGNLKYRTILMTMYSGGLRLREVLHLRPEDIDSKAGPNPDTARKGRS